MAEYSLLLALVAILCIATVTLIALRASDAFDKARDGIEEPDSTDQSPDPGGGGGGDDTEPVGEEVDPDCALPDPPPDCPTTTTVP
jgi:hypothetical protein